MPLALDLINKVLLSILLLLHYCLIMTNEHSTLEAFVLNSTQSICYYIRLPEMIIDHTIIILDHIHLRCLKLSLQRQILKTFVIGVDETLFSIKIVSPYFQCEHNDDQFQIMRRVVLFMRLQLP